MRSEPLFQVQSLTKAYGPRTVLENLSFDVARGECFVILGRSGSGKSVTLRQLNGLDKPDRGTVVFDGIEISALEEHDLYVVRRRVAMLFQSGALFDSMTVFENIAFPLREHTDMSTAQISQRVADRLHRVRLEGVEQKVPAELSGGMKKRVALARSLALDPEVVLFDEPTTGLDPMTSATIGHLIRDTQQNLSVTPIVVTHDLALARKVADRLAFLEGGTFRFVGTWSDAERSGDRLLTRFLAGDEEDNDEA